MPARKAHPGLLVEGLDALAERLQAAGHDVVFDTELPDMRRFYTSDQFGNRLEFLEHADADSHGVSSDGVASEATNDEDKPDTGGNLA